MQYLNVENKNLPAHQSYVVVAVVPHCQLDVVVVEERHTGEVVGHKELAVVVQNDRTVDSLILLKSHLGEVPNEVVNDDGDVVATVLVVS